VSTVEAPATPFRANTAYRLTGPRVLRSEWCKLWTLRSTWITLALSMVLLIGGGAIGAAHYHAGAGQGGGLGGAGSSDAVSVSLTGIDLAMLTIGVLGVLISAGEYSTGMIRSTMAAVPRRLPVLWSKALAYGAVTWVVATIGALAVFSLDKQLLANTGLALGLGDAGVLRAVLAAGLYLALIGVLGVALGSLLRSVAGGIGLLVVLVMLVGVLADVLPDSWQNHISRYLPGNAGSSMTALHHASGTLTPLAGAVTLALWVLAALAVAAWRLRTTDA
jgi:hypothetical protein